jgi:hypothetical protein
MWMDQESELNSNHSAETLVGYEEFLRDVKARVRAAQVRAALAVNRELVSSMLPPPDGEVSLVLRAHGVGTGYSCHRSGSHRYGMEARLRAGSSGGALPARTGEISGHRELGPLSLGRCGISANQRPYSHHHGQSCLFGTPNNSDYYAT